MTIQQTTPKTFTKDINSIPLNFLIWAAKKLHIHYIIHDGRITGWEDEPNVKSNATTS